MVLCRGDFVDAGAGRQRARGRGGPEQRDRRLGHALPGRREGSGGTPRLTLLV